MIRKIEQLLAFFIDRRYFAERSLAYCISAPTYRIRAFRPTRIGGQIIGVVVLGPITVFGLIEATTLLLRRSGVVAFGGDPTSSEMLWYSVIGMMPVAHWITVSATNKVRYMAAVRRINECTGLCVYAPNWRLIGIHRWIRWSLCVRLALACMIWNIPISHYHLRPELFGIKIWPIILVMCCIIFCTIHFIRLCIFSKLKLNDIECAICKYPWPVGGSKRIRRCIECGAVRISNQSRA